MKYRCIQVTGIVEVPQELEVMDVAQEFSEFAESKGWFLSVRWCDLKGHPGYEDVEKEER